MKKIGLLIVCVLIILGLSGCTKYDISLVYSATATKVEAAYTISNYQDYLNSDYELEIESGFFDDKVLYVYTFINNRLGKDLYLFDSYKIEGDYLTLVCKENQEAMASDSFGPYCLIFALPKQAIEKHRIAVSGVHGSSTKLYNITVSDPNDLVDIDVPSKARANETISFYTDIFMDAYLVLYVNGVEQDGYESVETDNGYKWLFTFVMPAEDVVLSFTIEDGFLPLKNRK